MKFRKKPVTIEAVQWTGENMSEVLDFGANGISPFKIDANRKEVEITTLEGVMIASVGDWIIRGIQGELYPCKPGIFEQTYEPL